MDLTLEFSIIVCMVVAELSCRRLGFMCFDKVAFLLGKVRSCSFVSNEIIYHHTLSIGIGISNPSRSCPNDESQQIKEGQMTLDKLVSLV